MRWSTVVWMGLCVVGCGGDDVPPADASTDLGAPVDAARDGSVDGASEDAPAQDAVGLDALVADAPADAVTEDAPAPDAGPEPTTVIAPVPGEVTLIQINLPGTFQLGEAGIVVGPDGTMLLMDVGNSSHDDDVLALIRALNETWITPARGFPPRDPREVEWVVLSHFHADHIGGFADLMGGIDVTRGVVHRGFTDLGSGVTENDYEEVCDLVRGELAAFDFPLCTAAEAPPCNADDWSETYPAVNCDGLLAGDLEVALDDGPSTITLGDGAVMRFVGASAHMSTGTAVVASAPFATDDNDFENARSLVALVEYGRFRYHWGGDLMGDGPDIEGHLVATSGGPFYGPLGMDVTHAHHHVRRTSSNATFVNAMAPLDGLSRNVVGGINGGHVGSPHLDVLQRWGDSDRLGAGAIWITQSAPGGDDHPALIDADANVIVQTIGAGTGYRVQAARDAAPMSRTFSTVR